MGGENQLVLIVDDEENLAKLASFFLEKAGFRTLRAASPRQALELWTAEVSILLTDCIMPEMCGDQLAIRMLELKPSLKVLFMSGNDRCSLSSFAFELEAGQNFIQKPFASEALLEIIQNTLSLEALER